MRGFKWRGRTSLHRASHMFCEMFQDFDAFTARRTCSLHARFLCLFAATLSDEARRPRASGPAPARCPDALFTAVSRCKPHVETPRPPQTVPSCGSMSHERLGECSEHPESSSFMFSEVIRPVRSQTHEPCKAKIGGRKHVEYSEVLSEEHTHHAPNQFVDT